MSSDLVLQLEALTKSPPADPTERNRLYHAARKLAAATEDTLNTITSVNGSPMILTFTQVACDLNVFKNVADTPVPPSSRVLRFLASNDTIVEAGEDAFMANGVTLTLSRPGMRAGIAHPFEAIMPCLGETPKYLADTGYVNPTDVLHSPFQIAHKTEKSSYVWAMGQPKLMADFNLWMTEQHQGQGTWLDVFDFAAHVASSSADTLVFVDVTGGLGQQCALVKTAHPDVPGRVVLQDQPFVLPQATSVDGVEKQVFDLWSEQPLKSEMAYYYLPGSAAKSDSGARIYYMRNVVEDYPDDKALAIIENTLPAMSADSVLAIDEMIIPNSGASPRSTVQDMIMMTSLASAERTERQWDALLDKAGLRVLQKTAYNTATGESVIVAVPK